MFNRKSGSVLIKQNTCTIRCPSLTVLRVDGIQREILKTFVSKLFYFLTVFQVPGFICSFKNSRESKGGPQTYEV